ncbi:MAG: DEAD/DEAH box helicase [Crocinitomicaceae bacterium]
MKEKTRQYLDNLGIETLTPMQTDVLEQFPNCNDLVILSPTGSGKTLAFLLPILEMLDENMEGLQAVIISPTRELALQIEDVFKKCKTNFKINITYGGHSMRTEKQSLSVEPTVLVATPGRLCDHLDKGTVQLDRVKCVVLDEFDKSLEMGFQEEMGYIIDATPKSIKTILSSATNLEVIPAFTGIENPVHINFLNELIPALTLRKVIYGEEEKLPKLFELICSLPNESTIIFCNHRDACIRICEHLQEMGVPALPFHGAMEQPDRERSLIRFRNGSANYLVATDLAARGLDIPDIGTVIHYQMPQKIDSFIHRNGRTARMLEKGQAVVFQEDGKQLPEYIETKIPLFPLADKITLPDWPAWDTIYFSGGKKEKINKIDLVGFLIQKGGIQKDEIGLITVQDHWSYVAVKADKIKEVIRLIRQEKIKGKRLKIELSR